MSLLPATRNVLDSAESTLTAGTGLSMALCSSVSRHHSDSEIMSGTPVFVGARVPFRTLIDYLEAGHGTQSVSPNRRMPSRMSCSLMRE